MRTGSGFRKGTSALFDALKLIGQSPMPSFMLFAVVLLVPTLLHGALFAETNQHLLSLWTPYFASAAGGKTLADFSSLGITTMLANSYASLPGLLIGGAMALFFTPMLLSSLSLLYTQMQGAKPFVILKKVLSMAKQLAFVALCCALAEYFLDMVPSILHGLLSAVLGILSLLPFVGNFINIISLCLTLLIMVLMDVLAISLFAYVWIATACEGLSGFSAVIRSFQLFRSSMAETLWSHLLLRLCIQAIGLVLAIAFAAVLQVDGIMPTVMCLFVLSSLSTFLRGALSVSLYQRNAHPQPSGGGPDVSRLKRANID